MTHPQPIELPNLIDVFYKTNSEVNLVSLSTSDGFIIHLAQSEQLHCEKDKIAAVTSTFLSVSHSIAKEFINSQVRVASIETDKGNFLCAGTLYKKTPTVLTLSADESMSLGVLRVKLRQLATLISKLVS